jgi:transposase
MYDDFYKLPKRPAYQCECGNQLYPLAGTPFHKTTTDLRTWFLAIFFMTNTRSGMSTLQFQRISGVTYKTAWRIFKQVRLMMTDDETLHATTSHISLKVRFGSRLMKMGVIRTSQ